MKSKLLLLSFLMLFTFTTNYAQTTGIGVQGIARDASNTALISQQVQMKFFIYYNDNGRKTVANEDVTLDTDAFGVFSHVIDVSTSDLYKFSNEALWLEITTGGELISNELLNTVPYAISANNGVPTGAIMPFLGTKAQVPAGWAMCDGDALPANAAKLKTLLGTGNAPNLQGMFLRGAGTNATFTGKDGPALKSTQIDEFQLHGHPDTFAIGDDGDHKHDILFYNDNADGSGGPSGLYWSLDGDAPHVPANENIRPTNYSGDHNHPITGSVGNSGGIENRPVNYGVNYIIKL